MDTNIEWLFKEVYTEQQLQHKLYFLSDWDSEVEDQTDFKNLLKTVHTQSIDQSFRYSFAYEQLALKNTILNLFNSGFDHPITADNLSLSPSATQSIFLTFQALKQLKVIRYVVITPAYFSTFDCLRQFSSSVIYYHLKDYTNFSIDFIGLEKQIREQYIECIVVTDPIFSAGIEHSLSVYEELAAIAKRADAYLVIDYSLGGLLWNEEQLEVISEGKLKKLLNVNKFVFIDSLSKRLQLNGIKFSLIVGSVEIIEVLEQLSESTYGGLNSISLEMMKQLYKKENRVTVMNMHKTQLKKIKANYELLLTLCKSHPINVAPTNSGFFTILFSYHKTFEEVDTQNIILRLLKEEKIIAIPNNRFSYYSDNKFGFRINLAKNQQELFVALGKAIGKAFY